MYTEELRMLSYTYSLTYVPAVVNIHRHSLVSIIFTRGDPARLVTYSIHRYEEV